MKNYLRHIRSRHRTHSGQRWTTTDADRSQGRRVHLRCVHVRSLEQARNNSSGQEQNDRQSGPTAKAKQAVLIIATRKYTFQRILLLSGGQQHNAQREQQKLNGHRLFAATPLDNCDGRKDARKLGKRCPQQIHIVGRHQRMALERLQLADGPIETAKQFSGHQHQAVVAKGARHPDEPQQQGGASQRFAKQRLDGAARSRRTIDH